MARTLLIGTRGSKLALWQARWVAQALRALEPGLEAKLKVIKTTGDKILDVPLAKVGGKGLFVKEIEEALLRGEVDLAVHSMKDVPTELPEGLHLAAVLQRQDHRDAFLSRTGQALMELPAGSRVGTSSLRRICQLRALRPELQVHNLRGNLDTRLRKLGEGLYDAIVVAMAGLNRLGLAQGQAQPLSEQHMLPAIGQGAIGVECRLDDPFVNGLLQRLNHAPTATCVQAERAFLMELGGGCQVPIGAWAELRDGRLRLQGLVGSPDGARLFRDSIEGDAQEAAALGQRLAQRLLKEGAEEVLKEVYGMGLAGPDQEVST